MPSPGMSKNESFYQLACQTTDTFASCIRIYENLLPYFETERPCHGVNKRLSNIGGMLTILNSELTTLKNEITTDIVVGDDDKVTKPSVKGIDLAQVVSDCSPQENIICETNSVNHKAPHKEEVLNKLPKRNWEDVKQVPGEEYEREKVNHEDIKIEQTLSHDVNLQLNSNEDFKKQASEQTLTHDVNLQLNSNEDLKKQASDFGYVCENCNKAITLYNQDLDLSIKLHNQDGSCREKPSKVIAVQKEGQEKKVDVRSAQEQAQNMTKYQKPCNRSNVTPACLDRVYKEGYTQFGCIKSLGNGFLCTVCNKMLAGPKNFVEHMRGNYHRTLLNESTKEIRKNTGYGTNIAYAQLVKSCENKSPTYVEQKESIPSLNAQLSKIIKCLSGSLYSERQYLSVGEGVILCNLCDCKVPPTVINVRDHVLGSRHSKNKADLQVPNNTLNIKL